MGLAVFRHLDIGLGAEEGGTTTFVGAEIFSFEKWVKCYIKLHNNRRQSQAQAWVFCTMQTNCYLHRIMRLHEAHAV